MDIKDVFISLWNKITGRTLLADIFQAEENIQRWLSIYRGKQPRDYSFVPLDGRKHDRTRRTMNAAKMVCSELSRLVWSENPEIVADKPILDFLESNDFYNQMTKFSEYGSAGGGFAIKLFSPDGKNLRIDYVPPDCFIPVTWDNGGITEADFLDKMVKDGKTYIRVEKHRKTDGGYNISSDVYEEDGNTVIKRSLADVGIVESDVPIKSTVPLFAYIATPEANNLSMFSPLGISIYANAEDTLESLDVAFDALSQEIVLGKKRIIVPATALRHITEVKSGKQVQYFDPSDEVYQAFSVEEKEGLKIVDNTVELRIEELRLAAQTLLDILAVQTGFSSGTFSFDGVSLKTATEVISESSKTFRTKQAYENQIGKGILGLIEAIKQIGTLYGIKGKGDCNITWNDSVIEDRNSLTTYWTGRLTSKTCTLEDFLMKVDGLPEVAAKTKAADIRSKTATVDVDTMFEKGA
jgi:A118 family predicted phage portal protein